MTELASVDQSIAANLIRLREQRGLSTTKLADCLRDLGHPIPATGITRIEKGQRRVLAAELCALAAIFGTPLDSLVGEPRCSACNDAPPRGFTCQTCGTESARGRR